MSRNAITTRDRGLVGTRQLALHTVRVDWPELRDACAHVWPELAWNIGHDGDALFGRHGHSTAAMVVFRNGSLTLSVNPAVPPKMDGAWQVFASIDIPFDDGKRWADALKQGRRIWRIL